MDPQTDTNAAPREGLSRAWDTVTVQFMGQLDENFIIGGVGAGKSPGMAIAFKAVHGDHSSNPFWTDYAQTTTPEEAAAAVRRAEEAVGNAQEALYLVRLQAIRALSEQHRSVRHVAGVLGVGKSTVARELKGHLPAAVASTSDGNRNETIARAIVSAWGPGFPRRNPAAD